MVRIFEGFEAFCLAVTLIGPVVKARISCKNDYNMDVDWFFIYKLPNLAQNAKIGERFDGGDYVYVDSNTRQDERHWKLSWKKIYRSDCALARTIAPLTAQKWPRDLTYAVYNDRMGDLNYPNHGYTKGLFMFGKETGVWVIHSVPNFPKNLHNNKYVFPESGKRDGHIILCATFPLKELKTIAYHVWLQHPNISDANPPASMWTDPLEVNPVLHSKFLERDPSVMAAMLRSAAGNYYTIFSKHTDYNQDAFSGLVAPRLEFPQLVATWRNARGVRVPLRLNGVHFFTNTEWLKFDLGRQGSVTVRNTVDQSKWVISGDKHNFYVCLGTLKLMFATFGKEGLTLCFENYLLYTLLCSSVTNSPAACSGRRPIK